eukprot:6197941-Pleurochrysis_carterae.AAC.1
MRTMRTCNVQRSCACKRFDALFWRIYYSVARSFTPAIPEWRVLKLRSTIGSYVDTEFRMYELSTMTD